MGHRLQCGPRRWPALCPILILWYLDRRERESPWLFAAAFLWGGLIATTLALPANTAVILAIGQWLEHNAALKEMLGPDAALMVGAPLAAPLVEETTKGLGIVLLFWLMHAEFDNVRDGFIYGALVGAGFNWFESALYVQQNFLQYGEASYGFQIGSRYVAPAAGYLLAVLAHTWNNVLPLLFAVVASQSGEAPPTASTPPPTVGLTDALVSTSVSNVVIFLPFALLPAWIIRRIDGRNRQASSALVNAQNELAFRRRRLRDRGFDPAADPVVAQWRSQIGELRQRLEN